jgi:hypothetical protein
VHTDRLHVVASTNGAHSVCLLCICRESSLNGSLALHQSDQGDSTYSLSYRSHLRLPSLPRLIVRYAMQVVYCNPADVTLKKMQSDMDRR